jgi:hypothetical protein
MLAQVFSGTVVTTVLLVCRGPADTCVHAPCLCHVARVCRSHQDSQQCAEADAEASIHLNSAVLRVVHLQASPAHSAVR